MEPALIATETGTGAMEAGGGEFIVFEVITYFLFLYRWDNPSGKGDGNGNDNDDDDGHGSGSGADCSCRHE
jgi:hypothetical protein